MGRSKAVYRMKWPLVNTITTILDIRHGTIKKLHTFADLRLTYSLCSGDIVKTPQCSETCSTKGIDFEKAKSYGKLAFSLDSITAIKSELMKNGPLTAGFIVYDDFFLYKEGIYTVSKGAQPLGE